MSAPKRCARCGWKREHHGAQPNGIVYISPDGDRPCDAFVPPKEGAPGETLSGPVPGSAVRLRTGAFGRQAGCKQMSANGERAPSEPQPTETYHVREECGGETDIRAPTIEAAREQAEAWIREGEYGEIETTVWVRGWIRVGDEGDEEAITVVIDPDEPACRTVGGRPPCHEWEDESVIGHGGGVITTELCRRCRLRRTTDTWAQDPETGEQGLRSVRYDPAEPEDEE